MKQEDKIPMLRIEDVDEAEVTFADDDTCVNVEKMYEENSWPADCPTGFSFKGKKRGFVKAVDNLKWLLKKGPQKYNQISFKILDSRKKTHSIEYDIEIVKDNETGTATVKFYGPNTKKGSTVMINKCKKFDGKFAEFLAVDVIKYLLDKYLSGEGKNLLVESVSNMKTSVTCISCGKVFANERNLKVHITKMHGNTRSYPCDVCDKSSKDNEDLKKHKEKDHEDDNKGSKVNDESKDVINDDKEGIKRDRSISIIKSCSTLPPKKKMQINPEENVTIEETMETEGLVPNNVEEPMVIVAEHTSNEAQESKISELEDKLTELMKDYHDVHKYSDEIEKENKALKTTMERLKKEDSKRKTELKQIKEENKKLSSAIGEMQYEKDKLEAKIKAEDKIKKLKQNTELFNQLIEKNADMEECDGGKTSIETTGYGPLDLQILVNNKKKGGKRTNPQENMECRGEVEPKRFPAFYKCKQCDFISQNEFYFKEHISAAHMSPAPTFYKCKHCDFISQNESYFKEHVSSAHVKQQICQKCGLALDDFSSLRKHLHISHKINGSEVQTKTGRIKPCRYFKNGQGNCQPRAGLWCQFDHTIIPFNEREPCFHKELCTYKPNCIFYHPEGQDKNNSEQMTRKSARICHYVNRGESCTRTVCSFSHPTLDNSSVFHWGQPRQPPIPRQRETQQIPIRIPVIVRNNLNLNSKKEYPDLFQSLKGLALD